MAERGQRTTLKFGGISAEVSLVKTSGKPTSVQHETKRFTVEPLMKGTMVDGTQVNVDLQTPAEPEPVDTVKGGLAELFGSGAGHAPEPGADAQMPGPSLSDELRSAVPPTTQSVPLSEIPSGMTPAAAARMTPEERAEAVKPPEDLVPGSQMVAGGVPIGRLVDVDGDQVTVAPQNADEAAAARVARNAGVPAEMAQAEVGDEDPLGETDQRPHVPALAATPETPAQHEAREQTEEEPPPSMFAPTAPAEQEEYVPPATRVEQGITLDDGTWIDLTERFAEVDERTKLDGLEITATIGVTTVPRERVRDAHYIAGVVPSQYKVLGLLWRGLRETDRAAVVRWTKKTAQACGIVVARGSLQRGDAHLLLLEVEWSDNMRPPGPRTLGPMLRAVQDDEVAAAVDLVKEFEAGPAVLNELVDERLAKRRELMERARAGSLDEYEPPVEPMPEYDDAPSLLEALQASLSWRREHAAR